MKQAGGRYFTQVATCVMQHVQPSYTFSEHLVVAIANDGTVWKWVDAQGSWSKLPEVPQDG